MEDAIDDRLDQKLHHVTTHQSRLGQHPAARDTLRGIGVERCISVVDIKGYLFAPPGSQAAPEYHNPHKPLHGWYRLSEFRRLEALPGDWRGWQNIPRHRWLSPHHVSDGRERSAQEMTELLEGHLQPGGRPLQLAACGPDGRERQRCFVTPDDWPTTTA